MKRRKGASPNVIFTSDAKVREEHNLDIEGQIGYREEKRRRIGLKARDIEPNHIYMKTTYDGNLFYVKQMTLECMIDEDSEPEFAEYVQYWINGELQAMISREEALAKVKEALAKGWNVSGTRDVLYVETE